MAEIGEALGLYTLLKRLAAGGMGEIYLASRVGPLGLAPPVALKVLRDEFAHDPVFVDMLVDEAKITMFLNHQNVVSVLDFGEHNGRYYIAMEYVQGVTLKQLLETLRARGRSLDVPLALYIAGELCRALKYAHTRANHAGEPLNIIHRDVTPGNLLLSIQGEVKLADFGIARAKNRMHETQAGVLKGKFGYMAPEMLRYEQIDARADLFCVGVILYEMIAVRHPVEGVSIMEAVHRFEEKQVPLPSILRPGIPPALDAIIMRALEPKPKDRWDSAAALGSALQEVVLANVELRREVRNGAANLVALIRELFPAALENPVPPALAEEFLAKAREREARDGLSRAHNGSRGRASGIEVRVDPNLDGLSRAQVARLPTSHAAGLAGAGPPQTAVRQSMARTGSGTEPERDTDEHSQAALAEAADLDPTGEAERDELVEKKPWAAKNRIPNEATVAYRGDTATEDGEIALVFPPPSNTVATPREELIEEPSLPNGSDKTMPVQALSRDMLDHASPGEPTLAFNTPFDSREVIEQATTDDSKTIATAAPDWGARNSEPPPVLVKTSLFEDEEERYKEEERVPTPPRRSSAYDDVATVFETKSRFEERPIDRDFADPALATDASEKTGEEALPPRASATQGDDTVLEGLSANLIAEAKQRLAAQLPTPSKQSRTPPQPAASPAFREATPGLNTPPKRVAGPLRIRVGPSGAGASLVQDDAAQPLLELTPPPGEVVEPPPRPSDVDGVAQTRVKVDTSKRMLRLEPEVDGAPLSPEKLEIGAATGRWIRGELPATDLSWGDDAAARRAVATRNAPPLQSTLRPPVVPQPMSQPPPPPEAPPAPLGRIQPTPPAYTQAGYTQAPLGPVAYPVPYVAPQRSWVVPIAISLGTLALVVVVAVLLLTQVAWPEVRFESEPPGATVVLDGRVLPQKTPVVEKLKPNVAHRVEIHLAGMIRRLDAVRVGYLQPRTFRAAFQIRPHIVNVLPVPGKVLLGGKEVGSGASVTLEPGMFGLGQVELTVEAPGYLPWTKRFTNPEELPASLDVVLQPEPAAPAPQDRR